MKNLDIKKNLKLSYQDINNNISEKCETDCSNCLNISNNKNNNKDSYDYDNSGNHVFGGGKIEVVDKNGLIAFSNKKVSYKEINDQLQNIYYNDNEYFSSAMDILASYVKGQKLIYMEAESYCQQKLNILMFPSIFSSATASVMATAFEQYEWGGTLISAINAAISFLLAIITYLKLDAQSEAHKTSAHKYDKLQSICEFTSGNLLLFTDMENFKEKKQNSEFFKKLQETIDSLETNIKDIKETNQFIVPKKIRHRYKIAYNINIFAVIKKINGLRSHYVGFIRDRINQIKMYKQKHNQLILNGSKENSPEIIKMKQLIDQEYYEKNYGFEKYQLLQSSFGIIDQLLADETEYAEKRRQRWFCNSCFFYKQLPRPELKNTLTYLITDPFSSLDNRNKQTYKNYLKKMHQKYDVSGNIFSLQKNYKSTKIIPTHFNGCFDMNKKDLELKTILQGTVINNNEMEYKYLCCKKKLILIILITCILLISIVSIVLSIIL
tara:strand:- start:5814 stop:7298 length:1485 start_codon:yes stop_codon:yes gene_type:complete